MNYMIYPNTSSFEELIKINKTLKANLIVYNADNHELFGFSQDYNDANVLKILEYNTYPTIDQLDYNSNGYFYHNIFKFNSDLPHIAILSKDLNAIYKDFINSGSIMPIGLDIYNLAYSNPMAFRIGCEHEERLCYDVFSYINKKEQILSEMNMCKNNRRFMIITHKELKDSYEFNAAFETKASEGIQTVHYKNQIFYIIPTVINKLMSDNMSLNIYYSNYSKILEFNIYKKNYIVRVIYRMIDTNLLRQHQGNMSNFNTDINPDIKKEEFFKWRIKI